MKKLIIILSILQLTSCAFKKENVLKVKKIDKKHTLNDFKGDTLLYIQTKILDRKEYYIGKKFEVLLNDLNLQIGSFSYIPNHNNIKITSYSYFEFYDYSQRIKKLEKGEIPVNLVVTWQTPLYTDELDKLIIDRTKRGEWTTQKKAYFKEQIVGDVGKTNYNLENYKNK
ncbi:hypothetical protein [Flavobacterium sp. 7A]|uniref:hypothetical protein n=1 Tax=Flavobacterium sp. 7A TaxID=2940571 RepID=UPI002227F7A6|nr:hypothetical protein [Flavobacterium sp. 7A]MCW2120947.1 hypothetical protein [Flavobacterium sp. 7A]